MTTPSCKGIKSTTPQNGIITYRLDRNGNETARVVVKNEAGEHYFNVEDGAITQYDFWYDTAEGHSDSFRATKGSLMYHIGEYLYGNAYPKGLLPLIAGELVQLGGRLDSATAEKRSIAPELEHIYGKGRYKLFFDHSNVNEQAIAMTSSIEFAYGIGIDCRSNPEPHFSDWMRYCNNKMDSRKIALGSSSQEGKFLEHLIKSMFVESAFSERVVTKTQDDFRCKDPVPWK